MISGGIPTIFVSSLGRAVEFYAGTLGLPLKQRFGDAWAEVDAGRGLVLGLHPPPESAARHGTAGGIQIGSYGDRPIEEIVRTLESRGVDGNELYLCELPRPG